ncbi:pyridoxal phosphate-dependent aminotransferase [Natrialbaceae archaeon AArc-T1-2]|uniref:pyridoxal phosphate-dependent aminotransferase n=1 Tax=Natrialbaceae archaeon AArc-T1-2 TaxID=3053904 RepID=UPI00255B0D9F|nr:pyridoxal phosphate-dependent aminotransferase [Natrialbaceae archaeon AArc-T1-2]WIV66506.1 pyridoxal phosphate-dependent aminotransferase [Natrialbaceae archaeon AArc-T1-2]
MEYETPLFFHVMTYAARADRDVIDMVSGNPDWEPPEALREGLREYADLESDRFQYPPSEGLRRLREQIATRRGVDDDQVIVTNGAGEANYLAMARALEREAGSEVLLTDPVYPYYPGKTTMLGGEQRFVAVDDDGQLDPAAVRAAASEETAAIVVNSPNNPTGAVYSEATMRELVAIAEAHDAVLVSDEVYDHYDLSGRFTSALEFDSDHRIVTNAFSKSMAITGFRVGYGVFPPELVADARTRHMLVNVAGSRPAQYAVARALEDTDPAYYEANRELLYERVETFTDALEAAGAEYTRPEGSFYVMARFDGFPGTLENVERLIDEAGVAGMPGEAFGSAREAWLRFALVTPRVEEAADRLATYFE